MANKQEQIVKSAVTREKNKGKVREEKHVLWLLVAIILFLLYLLFAQHGGWWPFSSPKLGSAFYTNVTANAPVPASASSASGSSSTGGGSGSGSGGGSGSTTPAASDSILDFAANVNVGDSKARIGGKANNLGSGCAVLVDAVAQTVGKQEVCTYSDGDKIVTVTYLNDRVISASKSGF